MCPLFHRGISPTPFYQKNDLNSIQIRTSWGIQRGCNSLVWTSWGFVTFVKSNGFALSHQRFESSAPCRGLSLSAGGRCPHPPEGIASPLDSPAPRSLSRFVALDQSAGYGSVPTVLTSSRAVLVANAPAGSLDCVALLRPAAVASRPIENHQSKGMQTQPEGPSAYSCRPFCSILL